MNETDLATLQDEMADRLKSDGFLADVAILVRRKGDIGNDVANSLGVLNSRTGKAGAVMVVLLPSVDAPNTEAPGPQLTLLPVIRCIEKVVINRGETGTQVSAEAMALRAARLFHLWRCDAIDGTLKVDSSPMRPATLDDPKSIGYDVFFQLQTGFDGARVTEVKITPAGGMVTLSCNTPGAAVYYTLDGSYPMAGGETTTLYTTPFAAEPGALIRAGAYVEGRIPSSISKLKLP